MFAQTSQRGRRILLAVTAVWAVAIVVTAFVASTPTVREQADAAKGVEELQEAMTEGMTALAGQPYPFVITPQLLEECPITLVRDGVEHSQSLRVVTESAHREQAAARMFEHLDTRYHFRPLSDHGGIVTTPEFLDLRLVGTGQITFSADTGCRGAEGFESRAPYLDTDSVAGELDQLARIVGSVDRFDLGTAECPTSAQGPSPHAATFWAELDFDGDPSEAMERFWQLAPEEAVRLVDNAEDAAYRDAQGDFYLMQVGKTLSEASGMTVAMTRPCG
ncbi:hypothetical protein [Natronoglycomyces albus]|uniref:Uncharacterized protein n=1 Tax=Natronoglycomyces albus TaxID=2811108 RepID=A0A895XRA6_9ACTN|nr:hypothetical protein [Natronoglycomyces albus]QSB05096.1 hypothetical protein JQS30_15260 [Natronoglycomyces albus]